MNNIRIAILCFALTALMSCSENLFGSSGGGNCGEDIQCLRLQAENDFRDGKYESAHKTYNKIVNIDSTASVGYFGMAKAGLWMKGINPFDVFRFLKIDDDKIPFLNDSLRVQNRYYQGMKAAAEPLAILQRRDTLTAFYEFYQKNPQNDSVLKFEELHCKKGVCKDTTGKKKDFNLSLLSDREYKYNSFYGGLLISTMAKTILQGLDNNRNGCITKKLKELQRIGELADDYPTDTLTAADKKKWINWGCENGVFIHDFSVSFIKDADGNFTVDLDQMLEDINEMLDEFYVKQLENPDTPLPPDIESINEILDEFTENIDYVIGIIEGMGKKEDYEAETGDTTDWQKEVEKYKDFAVFYKVSTRVDEDGDGCIDEELLNKLDNDGDGLKGENARLASLDPDSYLFGRAGINHSMIGDNPEDLANVNNPINLPMTLGNEPPYFICNTPDCSVQTELWEDSSGFVRVIGFTQEPGYWTTNELELKLKVAHDTICPPKYDLECRKEKIGGCWRYYDDEKFVKYWLRRKLARDQSRVHESCKNFTTAGLKKTPPEKCIE